MVTLGYLLKMNSDILLSKARFIASTIPLLAQIQVNTEAPSTPECCFYALIFGSFQFFVCWCYVKEVMENIQKRNLRCGSAEKFPHELFDFLRTQQSKYHSLTEMTAANVIAIVDLHLLFLFEITLNSFASLSIFTKCTLYIQSCNVGKD